MYTFSRGQKKLSRLFLLLPRPPEAMTYQSLLRNRPIMRAARVPLAHAKPINRQHQDIADQPRLRHVRKVLGIGQVGVEQLQLLKHGGRPGWRPGGVEDVKVFGLDLVERESVLLGQLLDRCDDALRHPAEDRVAGGCRDRPLAELDEVRDRIHWRVLASVVFDAHDGTDLVSHVFGDPVVDWSSGNGIGIGIDATLDFQEEVT